MFKCTAHQTLPIYQCGGFYSPAALTIYCAYMCHCCPMSNFNFKTFEEIHKMAHRKSRYINTVWGYYWLLNSTDIEIFILPSATGQHTWHGTREHKAAHAPVDVHQSHTCRRRRESAHHPRTAHWSCRTAADQCRTVPSHVACLQDSQPDSAEPVNISSQAAIFIKPPTTSTQITCPQPSLWLPLTLSIHCSKAWLCLQVKRNFFWFRTNFGWMFFLKPSVIIKHPLEPNVHCAMSL